MVLSSCVAPWAVFFKTHRGHPRLRCPQCDDVTGGGVCNSHVPLKKEVLYYVLYCVEMAMFFFPVNNIRALD